MTAHVSNELTEQRATSRVRTVGLSLTLVSLAVAIVTLIVTAAPLQAPASQAGRPA